MTFASPSDTSYESGACCEVRRLGAPDWFSSSSMRGESSENQRCLTWGILLSSCNYLTGWKIPNGWKGIRRRLKSPCISDIHQKGPAISHGMSQFWAWETGIWGERSVITASLLFGGFPAEGGLPQTGFSFSTRVSEQLAGCSKPNPGKHV